MSDNINTIKNKYLSIGDKKVIQDLKIAIKENSIIVTCMGLYNHGKSTLLNVLIDDLDNKTFKTADVRETSVNKTVQYGNIKFVDTPGLNAKEDDDKRVMDAVKESDINIFVHNVNTGEFVATEIEFLHNIKKHWKNPKEFIERTIFVLSRIDEANSDDDIKNTINKMQEQIQKIFEINASIIPVSSNDYVDGMIEKVDELIQDSNIIVLKDKITKLQDKLSKQIKQTKKDRLEQCVKSHILRLVAEIQKNEIEISRVKQDIKKFNTTLQNDIQSTQKTLDNLCEQARR
jgi:GTPase Era involved in 16S rRNA processing